MERPSFLVGERRIVLAAAGSSLALFLGLFALVFTARESPALPILGVFAHLAMLPLVAGIRAPADARAAGYGWLVVDIVCNVLVLNGGDPNLSDLLRLGGHVAAAAWILGVTMEARRVRVLGFSLGGWLGGYSLAAPWVPAWAFYPAFLLLLAWLAAVTWTVWRQPTPTHPVRRSPQAL